MGMHGSTNSLMSKTSEGNGRRLRRRRRQNSNSGGIIRSVSRISNDTTTSAHYRPGARSEAAAARAERRRKRLESDDQEIFKMSSASSIRSMVTTKDGDDEEEDEDDYSCSKTDIGSMLEADLRAFHQRLEVDRRQAANASSSMAPSPPHHDLRAVHSDDLLLRPPLKATVSAPEGANAAAVKRGAIISQSRQRLLRNKLEEVNKLQNEILKYLDAEIEGAAEEEQDDASELVHSLEDKTRRLRSQLLGGMTPARRVRTRSSSSSEYFPSSPQPLPEASSEVFFEDTQQQHHIHVHVASEVASLTLRKSSLAAQPDDAEDENDDDVVEASSPADLCDGGDGGESVDVADDDSSTVSASPG